jgi:hypothetical protein
MVVEAHLVKWLKIEIANLGEAGSLSRLELYHVVEGEGSDKIQSFTPEEGQEVDLLAQSIWEIAEHDSTTRTAGMPQNYSIWAYRGESTEPSSQHRFVLRGKNTIGLGAESSEPATDRGERSQQMRQLENQHRIIMNMATELSGRLSSEIERERSRRERSEDRMMELLDTHQQLLDRRQERDLERARAEAKERRMDMMADFLMTMAPLIVAKLISGKDGLSGLAGSARDQAIGKLLKSLSEEEIMGVFNSVKGQNQMALLELYKSYREDDEKAQNEKPSLFQDKERRLLSIEGGKK